MNIDLNPSRTIHGGSSLQRRRDVIVTLARGFPATSYVDARDRSEHTDAARSLRSLNFFSNPGCYHSSVIIH